MPTRLTPFLKVAFTSLLLAGVAAQAAPVTISDNWVRAGVSDYGTLGSNGSTSPGILFDKTGSSTYGIDDFLTPGQPFEGFYIASEQGDWWSNNALGSTFGSFNPVSINAQEAKVSATSTDGLVTVEHSYKVNRVGTRSEILIHTTLTNNSDAELTGLQFLRTLDPDPDVNTYGVYDTTNTVPSATRACAEGAATGQTVCIDNHGTSGYTMKAGVSMFWTEVPADYLGGLNDGDGDHAIGLAFDLGTLAADASIQLDYRYIFSENLSGTGSTTIAPVPTLSPFGLTLLASSLAFFGLRRKNKA